MTGHHSHVVVILIDQRQFGQMTLLSSMSISHLNAVRVNHFFKSFEMIFRTINNLNTHPRSSVTYLLTQITKICFDCCGSGHEIHPIFIAGFDLSRTIYHNYSMPWAKIITIPGSRIMSSLMWVLSQAITTFISD